MDSHPDESNNNNNNTTSSVLAGGKRVVKVPKGARDFNPFEMSIRQKALDIIVECYRRHGAVTISTPVFELRTTLLGQYGEDGNKLIYDLKDQGGEDLSLRYDLTVPLARYIGANGLSQLKRYQIDRVYRRDQPNVSSGRYREFVQCDFDICGHYDSMLPDAECISILNETLSALWIGSFIIKINHRGILDGILDICGISSSKFRTVCSALDKLDKEPWSNVRNEIIQKGVSPSSADQIGEFALLHDKPLVLADKLSSNSIFRANSTASKALDELILLFKYIDLYCNGTLDNCSFDLSLARGLDYYTGMILEAVLTGSRLGSIAGGGRYDNLIGIFSTKKSIPAVGFSIGIERVFVILEEQELQKQAADRIRGSSTKVLVGVLHPDLLPDRFNLCSLLWKAGIPAEALYFIDTKLKKI